MSFLKPDYNKEGAGISKEQPERPGIVRFFYVIGHRFWQIISLNAIYIFACLPIITIGPATAGLTYVLRNYSQEQPADMFDDFAAKAKRHFLPAFFVTLISVVIGILAWVSYNFWSDSSAALPSALRTVALVFTFFIVYMLFATNLYVYPMMVSFDLPFRKMLRNSMILALYKLGRTLLMFVFNILVIGASIWFFPVSLPFILFLTFSVCCLFNNFMVYPLLVRYVAAPKEEKSGGDDVIFKDRL